MISGEVLISRPHPPIQLQEAGQEGSLGVGYLGMGSVVLWVKVRLNRPNAVSLERLPSARHFSLLEAPIGQGLVIRRQYASQIRMHQANVMSNSLYAFLFA